MNDEEFIEVVGEKGEDKEEEDDDMNAEDFLKIWQAIREMQKEESPLTQLDQVLGIIEKLNKVSSKTSPTDEKLEELKELIYNLVVGEDEGEEENTSSIDSTNNELTTLANGIMQIVNISKQLASLINSFNEKKALTKPKTTDISKLISSIVSRETERIKQEIVNSITNILVKPQSEKESNILDLLDKENVQKPEVLNPIVDLALAKQTEASETPDIQIGNPQELLSNGNKLDEKKISNSSS